MARALHLLVIYLIIATYNIGYIMCNASGMMLGSLVFGLIKDSIVINRIKKEQKEIQAKKVQRQEILQKRKSTIFTSWGKKTMDTDRTLVTFPGK
jgi:23S rRNA A1618 N6-methylase RlmF